MTISSSITSSGSATQLTGLASGLDTSSLVAALMAAASEPQTLLNGQITQQKQVVTDLQTINGMFASLGTNTDIGAAYAQLQAFSATISDPTAATATASTSANAGSLSFSVDQLATSQVDLTAPMTSWPTNPPAITFVSSDGTTTQVTAPGTSLDSLVSAINGSSAGVTATKVQAGTDASGNPQYRLQLASSQTGTAASFTAYTGTDTSTPLSVTQISAAQDAQITLWPGTGADTTVTSTSNDFQDVLPGVDLDVTAVSSSPVTLSVSQDLDTESSTASAVVNSVNQLLQNIASGQATTTTTNADGSTSTVFGSFTADSTVRGAAQDLSNALTLDVNGVSPSSIGINLDEYGNITFDSDTFEDAMKSDPAGTTSLFNTIVGRVHDVADQVSDPLDGTITNEITADNSNIDSMQTKSDDMTTLLQEQQSTYEQEFAYMETQMSQIQSQGSYLTSYFDALNGSSSSSSSKSSS